MIVRDILQVHLRKMGLYENSSDLIFFELKIS